MTERWRHKRDWFRVWREAYVNHMFGTRPLSRRWCNRYDRWAKGDDDMHDPGDTLPEQPDVRAERERPAKVVAAERALVKAKLAELRATDKDKRSK